MFLSNIYFFYVFSPWETVHGSLLGLRVVVLNTDVEPEGQFHCEVRATSLRLLTHQEVRVRQAAGETMLKMQKHMLLLPLKISWRFGLHIPQ